MKNGVCFTYVFYGLCRKVRFSTMTEEPAFEQDFRNRTKLAPYVISNLNSI